jgi:hypothetical protein
MQQVDAFHSSVISVIKPSTWQGVSNNFAKSFKYYLFYSFNYISLKQTPRSL